jgi:hypothetical protein
MIATSHDWRSWSPVGGVDQLPSQREARVPAAPDPEVELDERPAVAQLGDRVRASTEVRLRFEVGATRAADAPPREGLSLPMVG